ncbi:response regulator [Larkinella soli]|uniref:response regulator n=1 Tax=Larkinella soli TaxID=1770527 RepID=UPI000FFBB5CF|nr:response regulator [Larkinella soli]
MNQTGALPATTTGARILIVEDNSLNQALLANLLRKYGLRSEIVDNGRKAVDYLRMNAVDLILMDIQMPEMDGLTATTLIRGELKLMTPIVAVTSYPEHEARPRCAQVGMNDFLPKPIQKDQLEEVLARFLPGIQSASGPSVSTASVVDLNYLEQITFGDTELLNELLTAFRDELPGNRNGLFQALEEESRSTFTHLAHRFQSSLNALAMLGVAAEMKKLEKNPDLPESIIREKLTSLFDEITLGLAVLDEQLKR